MSDPTRSQQPEREGGGPVDAGDSAAASRPNIIVILADDMGFSDVGCFGSEIETPHLDALATSGRRYTQMYNNCRCSPTRASLLTGLYPTQTGVGLLTQDQGTPPYQGFLNRRCVTLGEALRGAGYHTGISGKWHVAGNRRMHCWPHRRGFDESLCGIGGNGYYTTERYLNGELIGISDDPDFHLTDATTQHATATIRRFSQDDRPFFMYVAYNAPHFPLQAFDTDIARYRGRYLEGWEELRRTRYLAAIKQGVVAPDWALPDPDEGAGEWEGEPDKVWQDARMATYAAQVAHMDRGIGDIMSCLRDLRIVDNTLVLFMSDNGACSNELSIRTHQRVPTRNGGPMRAGNDPKVIPGPSDTWQSYGLSWANASNSPFRRFKRWLEEGGIAGPCIMSWPGALSAGETDTESVLHVMDLMPTFMELSGGEYPREYGDRRIRPVEGESFAHLLRSPTEQKMQRRELLYWEHLGHRAVRSDRWKIVDEEPTGNGWALFDMVTDRTETHDLASAHPEIVADLADRWEEWKARVEVRTWDEKRGYRP
jgi:arylsulfatase